MSMKTIALLGDLQVGRLFSFLSVKESKEGLSVHETDCYQDDQVTAHIQRALNAIVLHRGDEVIDANLTESLEECDLVIGNLECTLLSQAKSELRKANRKKGRVRRDARSCSCQPEECGRFAKSSSTSMLEGEDYRHLIRCNHRAQTILKASKVNVVSLSNNHALDDGLDGCKQTFRFLQHCGIQATGISTSESNLYRPVQPLSGVFVYSIADHFAEWSSELCPEGGIQYFDVARLHDDIPSTFDWHTGNSGDDCNLGVYCNPKSLTRMLSLMFRHERVDTTHVPFRILSLHCGDNFREERCPSKELIKFCERVSPGFDIIFNHSPHHFMGVQMIDRHDGRYCIVFHGLGDFISDYDVWAKYVQCSSPENDESEFDFEPFEEFRSHISCYVKLYVSNVGAFQAAEIIPIHCKGMRVRHAFGDDAHWILSKIMACSQELGTTMFDRAPTGISSTSHANSRKNDVLWVKPSRGLGLK